METQAYGHGLKIVYSAINQQKNYDEAMACMMAAGTNLNGGQKIGL